MDLAAPQTDAEFEAVMHAISTVYSLRAGMVLTDQHYEAIQAFDRHARRDEERATEAFHRGYHQGLAEGGGADVSTLTNKLHDMRTELTVQRGLRMFDTATIARLRKLVGRLSAVLCSKHTRVTRA